MCAAMWWIICISMVMAVIPEGSVFLLCGILQHIKECVSSDHHVHLKAVEGRAKAGLAVTNLCLLYTNLDITEDVMLLQATIYVFFFMDLAVCFNLVPGVWFTAGPTAVSEAVPPSSTGYRMIYIDGVVSLVAASGCVFLLVLLAKGKPYPVSQVVSQVCGTLLLLCGSWSLHIDPQA